MVSRSQVQVKTWFLKFLFKLSKKKENKQSEDYSVSRLRRSRCVVGKCYWKSQTKTNFQLTVRNVYTTASPSGKDTSALRGQRHSVLCNELTCGECITEARWWKQTCCFQNSTNRANLAKITLIGQLQKRTRIPGLCLHYHWRHVTSKFSLPLSTQEENFVHAKKFLLP